MKLAEALSLRADLQKEIDSYSKQLRELDVKIQQLNWLTELI